MGQQQKQSSLLGYGAIHYPRCNTIVKRVLTAFCLNLYIITSLLLEKPYMSILSPFHTSSSALFSFHHKRLATYILLNNLQLLLILHHAYIHTYIYNALHSTQCISLTFFTVSKFQRTVTSSSFPVLLHSLIFTFRTFLLKLQSNFTLHHFLSILSILSFLKFFTTAGPNFHTCHSVGGISASVSSSYSLLFYWQPTSPFQDNVL